MRGFDQLILGTPLDEWHEQRRDRAGRARLKRQNQTLEPGTQKDEPYVPLSGRDKVWFGIWQFWHWLTKEEPADLPRSVRQARRRSQRE
jgi:hypothetical protein